MQIHGAFQEMEGYRVALEHKVLFRDLDLFGHVNNVSFMAFMEDARVEYWRTLQEEFRVEKINFILGEVHCKYLSPSYFGETLVIGIRARKLGNKSFRFEYRMVDRESGRLVAEGSSVQVAYDYRRKCSVPLDNRTREAIAALEGLPVAELAAAPAS